MFDRWAFGFDITLRISFRMESKAVDAPLVVVATRDIHERTYQILEFGLGNRLSPSISTHVSTSSRCAFSPAVLASGPYKGWPVQLVFIGLGRLHGPRGGVQLSVARRKTAQTALKL